MYLKSTTENVAARRFIAILIYFLRRPKKSPYTRGLILIFFFVPEEVFLGRIIRPNFLDAFVDFFFLFFYGLKVLYYFQRGSSTNGIIDKLIACGRPRCVTQVRC